MARLYGYGTGSNIESFRYDEVANLLNQIPNNALNLIKASDVRDSVFSLWERVSDLSTIVASASIVPPTFMNPDPTPIKVGGIEANTTFPTPTTVQDMFQALLYPYTKPLILLTPDTIKEYGEPLTQTLTWSVTKKSNPILSVVVDGINLSGITGNNQSGTRNVTGTYSSTSGSFPVSRVNTFTMQVGDGVLPLTTTSATITWMNKIYWGRIDLSALTYPNPNLTLNPEYASYISDLLTSSPGLILALNGAGVGSGNELSTSKNKTYNGINGANKYLIFAWPSSVNGATTPKFYVGGFLVNLFTMVKTGWAFTNTYGVTTKYEVWISNTIYNQATDIIIS